MPKGSWQEFGQDQIKPISGNLAKGSLLKKSDQKVRVQKTKSGKRGKIVTEINGLHLSSSEAKELLKLLKTSCGTGGTIKDEVLELQGDQVEIILDVLRGKGYIPKQAGG